ncbi:hypothetical protein L596_013056 [Steinernema carpocapsae]|uniref:Uncharacterized protein n=1 Tax=Steinernema carpocapsae TaxID=34508 RepID=A0A4U5NZP8_STECR|nr:hypothetical protein L596_013056 [Steinernema carpocapsae]
MIDILENRSSKNELHIMKADPQMLFDHIRSMQMDSNHVVTGLDYSQMRILTALRELLKQFGVKILLKTKIPTPLKEFCLRLQYVITNIEAVAPLDESDSIKVFQTTWINVLREHRVEVKELLAECRETG